MISSDHKNKGNQIIENPWVIPDDVRNYTESSEVKARTDDKLKIDIARARQYVISYTNNRFDDNIDRCFKIPETVRTAVILLSEYYAVKSIDNGKLGNYKSETFDDYSYTLSDTENLSIDSLGIEPLLEDYIIAKTKDAVSMKLRKL